MVDFVSTGYTPNPLMPTDLEGKDIYLATELEKISEALANTSGWKDNFASLTAAATGNSAPAMAPFGPSGVIGQRRFGIGDSVYVIWHIDHDIKPESLAYMHVHWTTDGIDTGLVQWQISYTVSKGHNQDSFGTDTVLTLEEAASGVAWRHMVTEDATGFTIPEPDSLIIAEVKRIAPTSGANADEVFGLFVDIHYQSDRDYTPQRSPNFYEQR